jgi:site-specific recombinase XerD
MSAGVLQEIMQEVDASNIDPLAKQQFRQLVRTIGAAHGLAWMEREQRTEFARELLARKVSRPTVRDRLMAHFSISKTQAYRVIEQALQLSHFSPSFGTASGSNTHTNNP